MGIALSLTPLVPDPDASRSILSILKPFIMATIRLILVPIAIVVNRGLFQGVHVLVPPFLAIKCDVLALV